ncbi:ribosome-recycling factor isoform X1 [Benincasa hispida]|uniref:ribosome-recycling factor isoform X1 n=1 Tax=Benincasa hispida TaxID=102211 RepID=UPI001902A914|nr:ribosome-recycling factor isoform X1 [Benincasa hispida]
MAMFLKRSFSYRNFIILRNFANSNSKFSFIVNDLSNSSTSETPAVFALPPSDFVRESRRGFAKGRKSNESSTSMAEALPDIRPTIKANASSQMEAAIAALSGELSKLRTGRASSGMLDHIIVETSGVKMPLNQIAVVSVLDPKTLSINPYDPNTLKNLESAIVSSPLGLAPRVDGERLIAVIPPLTKEHIQAICKLVTKCCEDSRQSIRRARQKAMDTVKKMSSSYPKDDMKRLEKEVDELTKKFIKSAEDLCKAKEKEITGG